MESKGYPAAGSWIEGSFDAPGDRVQGSYYSEDLLDPAEPEWLGSFLADETDDTCWVSVGSSEIAGISAVVTPGTSNVSFSCDDGLLFGGELYHGILWEE